MQSEVGSLQTLAAETARRAWHMQCTGVSGKDILAMIATVAEGMAGDEAVCSILVLDRDGLLRNGASPNLPADYLKAIDGLKPDAHVGTCAAAAATGTVVVTPDFQADDKWAELRHLPLALGFVGAWSMPIQGSHGRILGTLGTYFRNHRLPTHEEVESVGILAKAAGLVIVDSGS